MNTAKKGNLKTLRNGVFWSSRYVSSAIGTTLFTSYLSFYATNVLGMSIGLIGTVLLITKLFDGVTDLAAGFIVDNTNTRWGKARPYDWCIPIGAVFSTLVFATPNMSQPLQAVWIGVMYILSGAVFGTLLGASENVYLLRAFPEEKERNSVFGISLVFGQGLGLVVGVLLPKWVDAAGTSPSEWTKLAFLALVPLSVIGMVRFFTIKEKVGMAEDTVEKKAEENGKEAKKKNSVGLKDGINAIIHNKYIIILTLSIFTIVIASGLLNTSASYYFTYFIGDISKMSVIAVASFASLIALVIFTPLSNKFGKANVMKACLIIASVGCIIRWIGGTNMLTLGIGIAMMLFGVMPLSAYFPLFLFDIMDYGEWKNGVRVEGVLAVFPSFALKVAGGLSVSLGAFILEAAGYDGTLATQSESAMAAISYTFNMLPMLLLGIMTLIMVFFFNIDRIMPTVTEELKKRHELDAE